VTFCDIGFDDFAFIDHRPSVVMKDQHVFVHRQTLRAILPTRRPMNMDGVHMAFHTYFGHVG
jgi:hypothetical protein